MRCWRHVLSCRCGISQLGLLEPWESPETKFRREDNSMVQSAGAENMRGVEKVHVPPIKTQGIKTKLVPWIARCAQVDAGTIWVEPFMGSGVVGFNLAPRRALFSDTNIHIINFYRSIQNGELTAAGCRKFLESEGTRLKSRGGDYFYEVRDRFNESHDPYDFSLSQPVLLQRAHEVQPPAPLQRPIRA